MAPKKGLASRYCIKRNIPVINHAKADRASNGVARGKNPEKNVRCKIDNEWQANPAKADHNPVGHFNDEEPSKKRKKLTDDTRYNATALLKKIRSKLSSH